MKELSIEQKAKAYDEAIKRAKSKIKNDKDHVLYEDDILDIFSELQESEDERIRKGIIKSIIDLNTAWLELHKVTKKDALAWLEKQGKQNPTDVRTTGYWHVEDVEQKSAWSEEDESWFKEIELMCLYFSNDTDYREEFLTWLKSLKERYTWTPTDEQIKAIRLARSFVTDDFADNPTLSETLIELEKQLKKLKEK